MILYPTGLHGYPLHPGNGSKFIRPHRGPPDSRGTRHHVQDLLNEPLQKKKRGTLESLNDLTTKTIIIDRVGEGVAATGSIHLAIHLDIQQDLLRSLTLALKHPNHHRHA